MALPHLFEFMDQSWVPVGLRSTLREILECGNDRPFRTKTQWVKDESRRGRGERGDSEIVELGAGTAPITRLPVRATPIGSSQGEVAPRPCLDPGRGR